MWMYTTDHLAELYEMKKEETKPRNKRNLNKRLRLLLQNEEILRKLKEELKN